MTELHWTEVDGVAVVWTDCPLPLRAGLLFRTGRSDETLTTTGWTHLLEHVALSTISDPARRHNGFVGGATTGFVTVGNPQEVVTTLRDICTTLCALPGDRLAGEMQVLSAESAARPYDVCANLLTWRFGARGYGLAGLPEIGQRGATIERLQEYASRRFTKGNAILWLSGPPPKGLSLPLPTGERYPLPSLLMVQQAFPSWFVDDMCGGIAAGAVVPRVPASSVYCEIAAERLRERMRKDEALSYAPAVFYDPLEADAAHLVLFADSDNARRAELAVAFGETFAALGEFSDSEVAAAQERFRERWSGSLAAPRDERAAQEVQRAAMDWILGREFEPLELLEAQNSLVSADDLDAFSSDVQQTVMFAMPSKALITPWIGAKVPLSSVPFVQGQEVRSVDAPVHRDRLIHGVDGLSVWRPDGSHCTVRYSDLAAAVRYEDGCVRLIGCDAATLTVEPTLWRGGRAVCQEISQRVPAGLLLDHGARLPDTIPKPATTSMQRLRELLRFRDPESMGALHVVVAGLGLWGLLRVAAPIMDSTTPTGGSISDSGPLALGMLVGFSLVMAVGGTGVRLLLSAGKRNASAEALQSAPPQDLDSPTD